MTIRISVDAEGCMGHSQCEIAAPDLFKVNDDGIAEVLLADVDDEAQIARAMEAVGRCPERVIHVEEQRAD